MKRISLIIIAVLFSVTAFAQQKYNTDFTQTKVMKLSGKTTNKVGHIVFDGNDQLRMIYSEPQGDYFIIEGNKVKMNLDGKKAELDAEKVKMVKLQRATLLNCLSGNWEQAAADNNAETTITEDKDLKTISIKAKGKVPKGGYKSVILTYRLSDGGMVKMVLEEAIGVINTYEIK
jgi:outer membrane lipoprotein-sorting protein